MSLRPVSNKTDCNCCIVCLARAQTGACDHGPDDGLCVNCAIEDTETRIKRLDAELVKLRQKRIDLFGVQQSYIRAAQTPRRYQ